MKTTNLESTDLFSLQMDAGSNIGQFYNPNNQGTIEVSVNVGGSITFWTIASAANR